MLEMIRRPDSEDSLAEWEAGAASMDGELVLFTDGSMVSAACGKYSSPHCHSQGGEDRC